MRMTRRMIILSRLAPLALLLQRLNARLGYPKAGVDVGGGRHAPPEQSATTSHTRIYAHPDGTRWGLYVWDLATRAAFVALRKACQDRVAAGSATATEQEIAVAPDDTDDDATWDPPPPVGGA